MDIIIVDTNFNAIFLILSAFEVFQQATCVSQKVVFVAPFNRLKSAASILIINGFHAKDDRQFFATIGIKNTKFFCGGSLIDEEWVLTAAHCLEGFTSDRLAVEVGDFSDRRIRLRRKHDVAQMYFAPGYSPKHYHHDIALLKLKLKISDTGRVLPMCQHRPPYSPVRPLLGACGMGTVSQVLFTIPPELQETYFRETLFRSESNPWDFVWCRNDLICVDAVTKGSNICHFDDGGPLYTFKCGTRIPECVYGVISYAERKDERVPPDQRGSEHCNAGSYFASVPHHYHWITRTMLEG